MTLEDKKKQLENKMSEINDECHNITLTKEIIILTHRKLRKLRMKIWNIDKRIKLNNKLKKVKDV